MPRHQNSAGSSKGTGNGCFTCSAIVELIGYLRLKIPRMKPKATDQRAASPIL